MIRTLKLTYLSGLLILAGLSSCDKEDADPRDAFTGTYTATEKSYVTESTTVYEIKIVKSGEDDNFVRIQNFYNAKIEVEAEITGGKLTIAQQTVNTFQVEGLGSLNGGELNLTYKVQRTGNSVADDLVTKCIK
jgi:hypothetical protein